ncbi:MAG TPA: septal ring lytic transglycosylase RlpA family protein [Polyangiales bacterium]|jgi:rare lipoprotein A|nr:septal ring lytic transglycosylase RlpA family protein [Polyangiales bacterium]
MMRGSSRRSVRLGIVSCALLCGCAGAETPPPRAPEKISRAASEAGPANTHFNPTGYYDKRALFVLTGIASYYGDQFNGRSTANGERYDPDAYTAAHRTLPFGTIIRVTRKTTGDWVLVRVNDRGPYGKRKRLLDLSKQAARRLGMLHDGVAQIRAEVLEVGQK